MKKLLLFTLLFSQFLFPQLKEMEVKPTENRGGIPIFRDFPDKAGIIFYAQFNDLSFYSSYGIVKVMDESGGKFVVIIEPVKQTLEVRAPGFKTEMIKLSDLQPRDVKYYEVLPKKEEGILGVSEVGVTVLVSPPDAEIQIDGKKIPQDQIVPLAIGKHKLTVTQTGYQPYSSEILITPTNNLFKVTLKKIEPAIIYFSSNPDSAEIRINNELKGITNIGIFLYPGEYDLYISKAKYISHKQKITITGDAKKDNFNFNLMLNRGYLELFVEPSTASIRINGEKVEYSPLFELVPGINTVEVFQDLYTSYSEEIKVEAGQSIERIVSLQRNSGKLILQTDPKDALIILNKVERTGKELELTPGIYEVIIKKENYKPESFAVNIVNGGLVTKEVRLQPLTGNLQFSISPKDASCKLIREDREIADWKGLKYFNSLQTGEYEILASASGYRNERINFNISENKTTIQSIELTKANMTLGDIRGDGDYEFSDGLEDKKPEVTKEDVKKDNKDEVFTFAELMPSFPGGDGALYGFLAQNIAYPEKAKRDGVEGQVIVMFTVLKTGETVSHRVVRGIGGGCDEEALRVVMMTGRWNPGKQNGQPVNVQITLPIRFQLQ